MNSLNRYTDINTCRNSGPIRERKFLQGFALYTDLKWRSVTGTTSYKPKLTNTIRGKPLGLFQKTIQLAHLAHSEFCPSMFSDDTLDLLTKLFNVMRVHAENANRRGDGLIDSVSGMS
jgi:hypothetical protein